MKHTKNGKSARCFMFHVSYLVNGGFTIIELLVVIIIISVLTSIIASIVLKVNSQLSFSRVVNAFGQDVARAEQLSLSSDQYKDANNVSQAIAGYGIYVDVSRNKQYILYADKAPGNQKYDPADYIVEMVDFSQTEPQVSILGIENINGTSASINFSPQNPTTTITPFSSQHQVNMVFALEGEASKTRSVSVNTAGLIEIK